MIVPPAISHEEYRLLFHVWRYVVPRKQPTRQMFSSLDTHFLYAQLVLFFLFSSKHFGSTWERKPQQQQQHSRPLSDTFGLPPVVTQQQKRDHSTFIIIQNIRTPCII
jgi:hypothetical protein